jgi:hypothetical protein
MILILGDKPQIIEGEIPEDAGPTNSETERLWRNDELLNFVDPYQRYPAAWHTLSTAQKDALALYRDELLNWPQHAEFPDINFRPNRPEM